ncbi:MAG: glycosyltransferase [Myxococcota bacterium]
MAEVERPGLLVLADDAWDGPKRARHKVPSAMARLGHKTLWIESDVRRRLAGRPSPSLRAVAPDLFVAPVPILRRSHYGRNPLRRWREPFGVQATRFAIRRCLRRLNLDPAWVIAWQDPAWADELRHHRARGRTTAYFASDLFVDHSGQARERADLARICSAADAVFCTSKQIAGSLPEHDEIHVIPHGIDLELWSTPVPDVPEDLRRIPHPRLLFSGVATVKFDVKLWRRLATERPDWQLVVVGPVDQAIARDWSTLEELPNVHSLGHRRASSLPGYLQHADVLAMPYLRDPVRSHSGLPNKYYEYLAAGRPILSTPFTEFEDSDPNLVVLEGEGWARVMDDLRGRPHRVPRLDAHDYLVRAQEVASVLGRRRACQGPSDATPS